MKMQLIRITILLILIPVTQTVVEYIIKQHQLHTAKLMDCAYDMGKAGVPKSQLQEEDPCTISTITQNPWDSYGRVK